MGQFLTAREAAARAGRSKSQINRDASDGKLPVAVAYPGYNGPRLFTVEDIDATYELDERAAS